MIAKNDAPGPNVVDLRSYQRARRGGGVRPMRLCRHCGAGLLDGEIEDDCSSAQLQTRAPKPRKFYAE